MSSDTDKILRDKMNAASEKELLTDFDEESVWEDIIYRRDKEQTSKRKLFAFIWPYAAILLLGLMFGLMVSNTKKGQTLCAIKSMPAKISTNDSASAYNVIPAPTASLPLAKGKSMITTLPKQNAPILSHAKPKEVISLKEVIEEPKVTIPTQPIVAEPQELAVVYFEDIQRKSNELDQSSNKASRRKLIQINKPQNNEAISQEKPIKNLIIALNQ
jgi:hypothetical protein